MIQADIQWKERYASHAINRKFTGVIDPGIYQGFNCYAAGADVVVGDDGVPNIAVGEIDGYSITVRMSETSRVTPSLAEPYVVLDVYYAIGIATRANLRTVASPAANQLILCRVTGSPGNWSIDISERHWGRTALVDGALARLVIADLDIMNRQADLLERVKLLEDALNSEEDGANVIARLEAAEQRLNATDNTADTVEQALSRLGSVEESIEAQNGRLDALGEWASVSESRLDHNDERLIQQHYRLKALEGA